MTENELAQSLSSLLGDASDVAATMSGTLDAQKFTRDVLGFM
jgi:hypothetical protein